MTYITVNLAGGDKRTLDADLSSNHSHLRDLKVFVGDGQWVDSTARGHGWKVLVPVWVEASGDNKVVNTSTDLELDWSVLATSGIELAGTKRQSLLLLGIGP